MAFVLDLMYSMIIGAAILVSVLSANEIASENQTVYNGNMLVQELLVSTAQLIEGEFRNMGFGVAQEDASVMLADTSKIKFLSDLGRDGGTIDSIEYRLGPTSELKKTMNELDRYLHRYVNGVKTGSVGVVTIFRLRYFARSGEQLTTPVASDRLSEIHTVEVTMEVQNPHAIARREGEIEQGERDALYSISLWQQTRLASQNSRR
ncbi:MAG: hypothetical protein ACKVRP_14925 [Bacteroidota bacterium]